MSEQLFYITDEDGWNQFYVLADGIEQAIEGYKRKLGFRPSNVRCLDSEFIDFIDATAFEVEKKNEQKSE